MTNNMEVMGEVSSPMSLLEGGSVKGILRRTPSNFFEKSHKRRVSFNSKTLLSPVSVADPVYEDISDLDEFNDTSVLGSIKKWNMKQTLMAWTSMVLAIFAAASIGPAFKYMETHGVGPALAASWRCQVMTIILLPVAYIEHCRSSRRKRVEWFKVKPGLTYPVLVHLIFSGLAWSGNLLCWINGLQYTTTFKASLIASTHPILLVFLLRFKGTQVSYLEWAGVLVAFGGMVLASARDFFGADAHATKEATDKHKYELLGFFLCFMAAVMEVLVLFNRIITKKYVPLMQYTAGTTTVVAIMSSIASLILGANGKPVYVFCGQENCIFGWTSHTWALKVTLFALWVGVVCVAGFNYAMQYIPPLVFSSSGLINPAVTAILAWACGIESLPSLVTWIGGFTVMTGVGIISVGDHIRTEEEHKRAAAAAGMDTIGGEGEGIGGKLEDTDGGNGMTLSVLHSGTAPIGGGRSSSSSSRGGGSGQRYYVLGTEDDEEFGGGGGGDIELGVIADSMMLGSPSAAGSSSSSVRIGSGDDEEEEDLFRSELSLSEEEERMLDIIRNKSIAQKYSALGGSGVNRS